MRTDARAIINLRIAPRQLAVSSLTSLGGSSGLDYLGENSVVRVMIRPWIYDPLLEDPLSADDSPHDPKASTEVGK